MRRKSTQEMLAPSRARTDIVRLVSCWLIAAVVSGCGGGSGGGGSTTPHAMGGTVTGLAGSGLVLSSGTGQTVTVTGGTFTFASAIAGGTTFNVTVTTQPSSPTQTCTVDHGSGSIGTTDVTNVTVTCTTNTYTVGGTVTGLGSSSGLVLSYGSDMKTVGSDSAFTFATAVASSSTYSVSVSTQPANPPTTCTIGNGSGTIGGANVTNVSVTCTLNSYNVGGGVAGLTGSGLALTLDGSAPLSITGNGQFSFPTAVQTGQQYSVAIQTQPSNQTCVVSNGSGTVTATRVISVAVVCVNPVGRFAYVTNAPLGNPMQVPPAGPISAYAVDSASGALTPVGSPLTVGTVGSPQRVVLDPLGRFVYGVYGFVFGTASEGIASFTIDPNLGTLTASGDTPLVNGAGPRVTADPSGKFLYLGNDLSGGLFGISPFTVDQTTGAPTAGAVYIAAGTAAPAIEPTGRFAYGSVVGNLIGAGAGVQPLTIDATTGALAVAGQPVKVDDEYLPAIDPTGRFLYVATQSSRLLYAFTIDSVSGGLTQMSGSPYNLGEAVNRGALAIDPRGAFLYVAGYSTPTITIIPIDSATGALGTPSTLTVPGFVNGLGAPAMAFDPSGQFVYMAALQSSFLGYKVDQSTGALSPISGALNVGASPSAVAILR